jgi:molybdopterin-guanine dinucleotide biosynthesis protein A
MSLKKEQITGLILAGGLSTRMGGVDKGLQHLDGVPMVLHVLNRIKPQVGAVMINANRQVDEYKRFGAPVCGDIVEGYAGPLAGIHAGLTQCRTEYLISVPCDAPLLPTDLVQRLATSLTAHAADAAVAATGNGAQAQRHPVFLLIRISLLDHLTSYLNDGGRKVDGWLQSLRCSEVVFDDERAFANANTREDLDALTRR